MLEIERREKADILGLDAGKLCYSRCMEYMIDHTAEEKHLEREIHPSS